MTYNFCTIATPDYLPFVQTLLHSLRKNAEDCGLHVLITANTDLPNIEGIKWYLPADLIDDDRIYQVFLKYNDSPDALRWALKPFFLSYLLQKIDKLIYVDNDIHFFHPYDFLFESLEKHSILLTPHWTCFEPLPYPDNFQTSFQIGLFNAGFIGATQLALPVLEWWGKLCLYKTENDTANGFFVDQRYLDMAPVFDEHAGIVRHRGCNLGSWNIHENRRVQAGSEILINEKYPVVFIHFNHETIRHIVNGNDKLLQPFFAAYEKAFAETGHDLTDYIKKLETWKRPGLVQKIKRKTLLRTRLKLWLVRLSQKL